MSLRWRYEGWRKLYIREEGSFAQLPLYTRAFAAEMLKYADNRGRIALGGKEPHEAIAMRCGATRGDRRMIKRDVGLLIKDGYWRLDGDELVIKNFLRAHPHLESEAAATPIVSQPAPVAQAEAPAPIAAGPEPTMGDLLEPYETAAASPCNHEQLTLPLPGTDDATTVQRNMSDVPVTQEVQSEDPIRSDKIREDKRGEARRLAMIEVEMLTAVGAPIGPRGGVEKKIHALLLSGWTAALLEEALHSTAEEAADKKTLRWWNGVDNWKDDSVRRALARRRPILRTVKPTTPEPTPTDPPLSADELRKMRDEAWAEARARDGGRYL